MSKIRTRELINMDNIATVLVFAVLFFMPSFPGVKNFALLKYAGFTYQVILAMSVVLVWGYCGIYSFAQAAFFGLSGYCYAVLAMNLPDASWAWLAAIGAIGFGFLVALLLGYFMFYGGVNDSFIGILTLCFTTLCQTYFMQTADTSRYRIGKCAFNGYNGINKIPKLLINGAAIKPRPLFYISVTILFVIVICLVILKKRNKGYALIAIRENPTRAGLLGYNNAKIKMITYAIGGAIAGIAGVLYIWWGGYIVPTSMSLTSATIPIVIAAAGGRKSPIASVIFGFIYLIFSNYLSYTGSEYSLIILGAILLIVVLIIPNGAISTLLNLGDKYLINPLFDNVRAKKNKAV